MKPRSRLPRNLSLPLISDIILFMIITIYCFLEYKFNLYLFQQMSVSTSRLAIDYVENLGRTLSGIGLALLAIKYKYNEIKKTHGFVSTIQLLVGFVFALMVCIPLSFVAQTNIVKYIVNNSSPADRRDAILTASVNSTLIPYYSENNTNISFLEVYLLNQKIPQIKISHPHTISSYEESLEKKEKYYSISRSCVAKIDNHQTQHFSSLDLVHRAFYSLRLMSVGNSIRTELEEHITSYYKCLIEDEDVWKQIRKDSYIDSEIDETNKALKEQYNYYESKSKEYDSHMDKARYKFQKDRIQEKWREGVEQTFGQGVYIKPGLSFEQFKHNKAVKNLVLKENLRFTVYDSDEEIKRKFIENLPNNILLGYDYYMKEGDAYDKQQKLVEEYGVVDCNIVKCYLDTSYIEELDFQLSASEQERTLREAKIESGKQSYKAIVIPVVALVLSLFFLGTNLISIMTFIISLYSKKLALIASACLLSIYIFYPYVTNQNIVEDDEHKAISTIINWASFYQSKVYGFQSKS